MQNKKIPENTLRYIKSILPTGLTVDAEGLIEIVLEGTNSKIVQENKDIIYASVYRRLDSVFSKDKRETLEFGADISVI